MSSATRTTTLSTPTKMNGSVNGNGNALTANKSTALQSGNKRLELEKLIREFQAKLGPDWDKYHENLSYFLIGKLSRQELVNNIVPILKNGLMKYHNKLLLLNFANSFSDIPIDFQNDFASFWNKKAKTKTVKSSQFERFKQNILGLPIKERRRIRNITRDSGKKNKISAGITLTRHALLPKIPSIQDKEQQQLHVNNIVAWQQDVVNGINTPISTETYELPDDDDLAKRIIMMMRESGLTGGLNPQVMDMVLLGLETYLKNIVESSIDVARLRENKYNSNDFLSDAIQTVKETQKPIIKAIPDDTKSKEEPISKRGKSLRGKRGRGGRRGGAKTRSRSKADSDDDNENENDKDGESEDSKSKVQESDETNDPKRRKLTLSIEDMYNTFEMFPYLVENNGPKYRLGSLMLKNDDEPTDEMDYELPKFKMSYLSATSNTKASTSVAKTEDAPIIKENEEQETIDKPKVPDNRAHIGTTDELKWVVHDLFTKM